VFEFLPAESSPASKGLSVWMSSGDLSSRGIDPLFLVPPFGCLGGGGFFGFLGTIVFESGRIRVGFSILMENTLREWIFRQLHTNGPTSFQEHSLFLI
jgi:hypothetical protein